jgi:hypothetical protein
MQKASLLRRLNAQVRGQQFAQPIIFGQGLNSLSIAGQRFNEAPMGALVQAIDPNLLSSVFLGFDKSAALEFHSRQRIQCIQCLPLIGLSPGRSPVLEIVAIDQVEVGQKGTSVQPGRQPQAVLALKAGHKVQVVVSANLVDEAIETVGVQFEGDIRVNLNGQAVAQEKGRLLIAIYSRQFRDHPTQTEKRLAQIGLARLEGQAGPKQLHECLATMGHTGLNDQKDQQSLDFERPKLG